MTRPIVWSVAGSDSGGGAGLQADMRAFDALRVHGCSAVAAITAQNSREVRLVQAVAPELLDAQLAALADDMPPRVIKTGLLGSVANLRVLLRWLARLRDRGPVALVVDPVWRASSDEHAFVGSELRRAMRDELLPLADVCTPNRREAGWLLGASLGRGDEARLRELAPCAWVVTGGDEGGTLANDVLVAGTDVELLSTTRIETPHHHGSGCSFAAALAAALAHGHALHDAVLLAKMAVSQGLLAASGAGRGAGPVRLEAGFAGRAELLPVVRPLAESPASGAAFAPLRERGLYAVVDSAAWVERLCAAGVGLLQLRIKTPRIDRRLRAELRAAVELARGAGARLFINDHWQAAIELGADGVHLGQEDLTSGVDLAALQAAGLQLGLSSHSPWELARALALQPSYVACGPVNATNSKAMPWRPKGMAQLRWWVLQAGQTPVVAIGGLRPQDIAEVAGSGAAAAAVLSGLCAADDWRAALQAYQLGWLAGLQQLPVALSPELPAPSRR